MNKLLQLVLTDRSIQIGIGIMTACLTFICIRIYTTSQINALKKCAEANITAMSIEKRVFKDFEKVCAGSECPYLDQKTSSVLLHMRADCGPKYYCNYKALNARLRKYEQNPAGKTDSDAKLDLSKASQKPSTINAISDPTEESQNVSTAIGHGVRISEIPFYEDNRHRLTEEGRTLLKEKLENIENSSPYERHILKTADQCATFLL